MYDFLTIRSKDLVQTNPKKGKDSKNLLVRVAATHAGIVNGNMRFYCPDMMQAGTHTWLPAKGEFARPILIGHNEDGAVLGRVMDAKFIDESYKYKGMFTTLRDSAFYADSSKKKVDRFKTIDFIVDNLMPMKDYRGLGYIELGLKITNGDAIQKVFNEEYLTVSVGFKTDSAICSICKTDWAVDDRCEHHPGEMVDGKKMFLISGNMNFEEVSFVNFPADPYAGVISKEALTDSLMRTKPFFLGLTIREQAEIGERAGMKLSDSLYGDDIQIVEDNMPEQEVKKIDAELETLTTDKTDMSQEEKDAALAEANGAPAPAAEAAEIATATGEGIVLTDNVKALNVQFKDEVSGKDVLGAINSLDSTYQGCDDDTKSLVRSTTSALVERWYADGYVEYLKGRLAQEDSLAILSKDEKDSLEAAKAELEGVKSALTTANDKVVAVFANYKKSLASQIVLGRIASGSEGFKGLSKDQIDSKVAELSKRHVSSLNDTVNDLLSELKFVDAAPATEATREETPEVVPTVTDNAQVAEPAAPQSEKKVTDAQAETDAAKAQRLQMARLSLMSPRERAEALFQMAYDARRAADVAKQ